MQKSRACIQSGTQHLHICTSAAMFIWYRLGEPRVTGNKLFERKTERSCLTNYSVFLQEGRGSLDRRAEGLHTSQAKARVQNHAI